MSNYGTTLIAATALILALWAKPAQAQSIICFPPTPQPEEVIRGCSTIFEKSYAKPSPQPALAYIAC
jgi:hypothetical protein